MLDLDECAPRYFCFPYDAFSSCLSRHTGRVFLGSPSYLLFGLGLTAFLCALISSEWTTDYRFNTGDRHKDPIAVPHGGLWTARREEGVSGKLQTW